ncbi:phosphotriesterase family protein [Dactylosporangium sp. CA-092794]|uniref:phosphotriesterase family protein n=1 Tax=Dactylosporangium sp. CA-092794 TaxID=3239929 RepID=UPI003D8F44E4
MTTRTVATVSGEVRIDALGLTLMHEHVVLLDAEVEVNRLGRWRDEVEIPAATASLIATRVAGVDTIVDLTAFGMGRNVERVRRIAEGTGMNVVVATGIYAFERLPRFFAARGPQTVNGGPDPVEAFLVREILEGIAGTGIRAGIIKCGTDVAGLTPDVTHMLRAAARAHRRTGVPISTHTDAASFGGRDQQALFRAEGVDLSRVVIGHCGDSTDLAYLTELMDAGSYIGMDRFGYDARLAPERRLEVVAELVRRGYAGRMLLSHDAPCYSDTLEPDTRKRLWPNCSHTYIPTVVLPALRGLGVGDDDIDRMTVRNPRDVFSRNEPY